MKTAFIYLCNNRFFLFIKDFFLSETWVTETEERRKDLTSSGSSQNGSDCQGWSKPKPRVRILLGLPCKCRGQGRGPSSEAFSGAIAGSWIGSGVHLGCQCCRWKLNRLYHSAYDEHVSSSYVLGILLEAGDTEIMKHKGCPWGT